MMVADETENELKIGKPKSVSVGVPGIKAALDDVARSGAKYPSGCAIRWGTATTTDEGDH